MTIDIELFTDPACPFAFSAEPVRQRLRWHYGDGLRWRTTMIVLTLEPGEAEKLQAGAPGLQEDIARARNPTAAARALDHKPETVVELLRWFGEPLATVEVEAIMGRPARTELGRTAQPIPAGADFYWTA